MVITYTQFLVLQSITMCPCYRIPIHGIPYLNCVLRCRKLLFFWIFTDLALSK
jgi:hypothetical protein